MSWETGIPGKDGTVTYLSMIVTYIPTRLASPHLNPILYRYSVGRWCLQSHLRIPGGVPVEAAQVQVRASSLPSERLPLRHDLSQHP